MCTTTNYLGCIKNKSHRYIKNPVDIMTNRVQFTDEDYWEKLKLCMNYPKGKIFMKLTLKYDSLNMIKWDVDVSFITHNDCHVHTGETITL